VVDAALLWGVSTRRPFVRRIVYTEPAGLPMARLISLIDSPACRRSQSSFFRSSDKPGRPSLAIATSKGQDKETTPVALTR
jgi:hypothetical protein